ncbi:MAG TPA: hypothetical protein VLG68_03320 [Gammaproteobacteria bacterium]|nr:hypothetical protein [Gammaproteobacteria bacterium]
MTTPIEPAVLDDDTLLAHFERCELPTTQFKHREHLRVAWILLSRHPLLYAMQRFRRGLKAYAVHNKVPGLYNETITCFYLLLIRERMDAMQGKHGWQDFEWCNSDLFGYPKSFLAPYYPSELAFSAQAKQVFLFPESV